MNYTVNVDLAIYPCESQRDLLDDGRGLTLPRGAIAYMTNVLVKTESTGPDPLTPGTFQIMTSQPLIYTTPRLVKINKSQTIISAFAPRQSGTLGGIDQLFFVILAPGGISQYKHPSET